ncbi:MAG TPA: diguanylate cyclase, partial [Pirellulales bacterium]|nr:diguanylate cyclase [Pirellulales bacterium]
EAARILDATMREMDLVARCGLEQFALLLPATRLPEATRAAERARQAIETKFAAVLVKPLELSLSAGVAESLPSDNGRSLLDRAEAALTVAKEAGGKCGYFHDGNSVHPILSAAPGLPSSRLPSESAAMPARNSHYTQYVAALNVDARTDALTGLPNRRAFGDELRRQVTESRQTGIPLSLLVVGVDNLPKVSAYHGQAAADQLLRKLAQIICAVVRESDLVTRYGWEEFAVILSGTTLHEARNAHQRILAGLAACDLRFENISEVMLSAGFAEMKVDDDAVTITQRADERLQASKMTGGQPVRFEQFRVTDSTVAPALIVDAVAPSNMSTIT